MTSPWTSSVLSRLDVIMPIASLSYSGRFPGSTVTGWRNAKAMYASVATAVPRTRAGRNVHRRAASSAGSSKGRAERITFTSATPPPASTRASTNTIPLSRARGGYRGITVVKGNGVSFDADATFLGGSPSVGVLSVGGRNIPATSTVDSTGFRVCSSTGRPASDAISSSAERNCQPRTASLTAAANGAVAQRSDPTHDAAAADGELHEDLATTNSLNRDLGQCSVAVLCGHESARCHHDGRSAPEHIPHRFHWQHVGLGSRFSARQAAANE